MRGADEQSRARETGGGRACGEGGAAQTTTDDQHHDCDGIVGGGGGSNRKVALAEGTNQMTLEDLTREDLRIIFASLTLYEPKEMVTGAKRHRLLVRDALLAKIEKTLSD